MYAIFVDFQRLFETLKSLEKQEMVHKISGNVSVIAMGLVFGGFWALMEVVIKSSAWIEEGDGILRRLEWKPILTITRANISLLLTKLGHG